MDVARLVLVVVAIFGETEVDADFAQRVAQGHGRGVVRFGLQIPCIRRVYAYRVVPMRTIVAPSSAATL